MVSRSSGNHCCRPRCYGELMASRAVGARHSVDLPYSGTDGSQIHRRRKAASNLRSRIARPRLKPPYSPDFPPLGESASARFETRGTWLPVILDSAIGTKPRRGTTTG
jgi:hypothetical protein